MKKNRRAAGASMSMKRYGHRAKTGARPGLISVPDDALKPTLTVTSYGPDEVHTKTNCTLKDVESVRGKHDVLWLDVVGLGDGTLIEQVGELFGLHRLALGDVAHIPQRAKVEHYHDHIFVIAHLPKTSREDQVEQISFFVGKDFVISWRERPGNCFDAVRDRLGVMGRPIRRSGPDYLLYTLVDAVIDAYFPVLGAVGDTIDDLDESMAQVANRNFITRVHGARHDVRLLRRIVWPMREAVDSLMREHGWLINVETSIYFRDCHDHLVQIIDTLENYREACADLRDFYATEISNRMNEVMKVLTVIATTFIPLSFIAGVYGMNFDPDVSPMNMPELSWYWGYPFALSMMAAVAIGQLLFFRRKGWLRSTSLSEKPKETSTKTK